jgi:2'-5' RNA ligase
MTGRPGIAKYFIALVPPSPIYEQAWQWKEYFKVEFNSKASLNSPPHITLHMPFEWKSEKESKLIDHLRQFSLTQSSFELVLKDFGCFPPRVIFIDLVENPELTQLQAALNSFCKKKLNLFNANRLDQPYHPHLTVAFRDLKKSIFEKAWGSVKNVEFSGNFLVSGIMLLKRNGKSWEAMEKIAFHRLNS